MTHRERFRAALRGERPDRVPAVCRLDIWHRARKVAGDLPPDLEGRTLEEFQLGLGFGVSARAARVFKSRFAPPVRHVERREGPCLVEEWHSPKGSLRRVRRFEGDDEKLGIRPAITEFPIRSTDDYAIFEEVVRHQEWVPDFEAYREYDRKVGENGLPMVILGPIPIHDLILGWTGYETGFAHLHEEPGVFLHAVEAANEKALEMIEVLAASPAELVLYGAHYDSRMTPPPLFRKHFLPFIQGFNGRMHSAGKKTAFHADADLTLLLDLVLETGHDVMDCLATEPLVPCSFREIRRRCGERVVCWGGVPSTLLEAPATAADLRAHLERLFAEAEHDRNLILGLSDQAMPGSGLGHLRALSAFLAERPRVGG
jgi:hypothetical protein